MHADDESVIFTTPNAPWLPPGGAAEVLRRPIPPRPMCIVRLLLRRADSVFCVPRPEGGRLDLPMRRVGADDPSGVAAIRVLVEEVIGHEADLTFTGAVRNVVGSPRGGYEWPTPHAYFGVWASPAEPSAAGEWLALGEGSPLRDRHWYPLTQ